MWNISVITTGGHPGACACLWLGEQLPLRWAHCQGHGTGSLTKISCPVSHQLLCPRAWQPLQGICPLGRRYCLYLWGFSRVVGWVFVARIWSGKAASMSSSYPHFGQSLFQPAPRQSHCWPKLRPSAACSWLWGKGHEVDNEALGSWKCEPKSYLLCTLPCQHASASWGCTGGCEGTQWSNWPPVTRGISHSMWCHAQQSNHGDGGWQGLPWLRNWLGISLLFFLGFKVFSPSSLCGWFFFCFWGFFGVLFWFGFLGVFLFGLFWFCFVLI